MKPFLYISAYSASKDMAHTTQFFKCSVDLTLHFPGQLLNSPKPLHPLRRGGQAFDEPLTPITYTGPVVTREHRAGPELLEEQAAPAAVTALGAGGGRGILQLH